MNEVQINANRRGLLKLGSIAVVTIAMGSQAKHTFAQAKSQDKGKDSKGGGNHVDENDSMAQSLGYKHDATKVDKAKFKTYQAGQMCSNCQQFQGKPSDAWAPCTIFGGKEVANKGWCSAWVKKT